MSWRITALQSLIIIGLSYLAIQYFSLSPLRELQSQQEDLSADILATGERIERLEEKIKQMIRTGNDRITNQPFRKTQKNNERESALYQRIRAIEEREKELEERVASMAAQQERQFQQHNLPEQAKPHGWLSTLPEEKKSLVKEIYKEQLAIMQDKIPISPGDVPPSPEEMRSILQASREELKRELEYILTEEEYESFMEILNKTQLPPVLPPVFFE